MKAFFSSRTKSKAQDCESAEELSDLLKGGDVLDFINQIMEELEKNGDGEAKLDFKTIAKFTASMNRTKSEKVRTKSVGGVIAGRVERAKSMKEKSKGKEKRETHSLSDELRTVSRLSAVSFNTERRSTLGEVDVAILDEDQEDPFPKETKKMDFKSLGMGIIGINNAAKGLAIQKYHLLCQLDLFKAF